MFSEASQCNSKCAPEKLWLGDQCFFWGGMAMFFFGGELLNFHGVLDWNCLLKIGSRPFLLKKPTITTIHDPNNQNSKLFASFTWKTARCLSIKQLWFQEWFRIAKRRSFGQPCWPPTSQREVVQNEQRRYIDIVTVMKGRQPVKTRRKLYSKKKLEHRTQPTHSTNMSGKIGRVLFSKEDNPIKNTPTATTWWVVFCGVVAAKKTGSKTLDSSPCRPSFWLLGYPMLSVRNRTQTQGGQLLKSWLYVNHGITK